MKVLHYPAQTGPVDDRIIGIGAHTELSQRPPEPIEPTTV